MRRILTRARRRTRLPIRIPCAGWRVPGRDPIAGGIEAALRRGSIS
jgi:hypothetical protein